MADLVNGAGYTVSAQDDADFFLGLIGDGRFVLQSGKQLEAEIIDNNTVRIYDGVLISQGRRLQVKANTYDDFAIATGAQNTTRYDILGYRLYKNEDKELCETFVQQDVGVDGSIEEESLRDGANEAFVSVYKAKIEGLTLTELIPLYDKVLTPIMNLQKQIRAVTTEPTDGEDGDVYIVLEG